VRETEGAPSRAKDNNAEETILKCRLL